MKWRVFVGLLAAVKRRPASVFSETRSRFEDDLISSVSNRQAFTHVGVIKMNKMGTLVKALSGVKKENYHIALLGRSI